MINSNKYFKFYNFCVPVKGYNSAVIYDLQRMDLYFVPNTVIDMLQNNENKKLLNIYEEYSSNKKLVTKYLSYLLENELIFLTDEPLNFPDLDISFKKPFILDVLFLEIDKLQKSKIQLLKQLDVLGCVQVVLLTKKEINIDLLRKVLELLKYSKLQVIMVITKYHKKSLLIEDFYIEFPRLREVLFFDAKAEHISNNRFIKFSSNNFHNNLTKKISSINDFVLTLDAFIEAQNFNLFFNRKIYVDNQGNIKHYYNDKSIYGNIEDDNILNIIQSNHFQELWLLTKDKIEGCKFCEFRFICPDNRFPLKDNKKNRYFQLTNCNYDPKTNKWQD